jgi:hypothetical protein
VLDSKVAFTSVRVWAEATLSDGTVARLDLVAVSMTFQENRIPSCNITLAVGESPQAGKMKKASAHEFASKLMRRDTVKVYADLRGNQAINMPWGLGNNTLIFEGYVSRPAYNMSFGAAGVNIELTHWLSDLACTDKMTYLLSPACARAFTRGAVTQGQTGGIAMLNGKHVLEAPNAHENVWAAIKKTFEALAEMEHMNPLTAKGLEADNQYSKPNKVMLRALKKMDLGETMPLTIDLKSVEYQQFVSGGLIAAVVDRTTGNSCWETLVNGLAPDFSFSVIPLISTATCAPVVYSCQGTHKTVKANEYWQIGLNSEVRALPIKTVRLYGESTNETGGIAADVMALNRPLGSADLTIADPTNQYIADGQVSVVQAPKWLHAYAHAINAKSSTPSDGARPSAGNPLPRAGTPGLRSAQAIYQEMTEDESHGIGNRLAQCILSTECLRNRMGDIRGRLRFDIAPGSSIEIGIVGKNVPFYGQGGNTMYGHVFGVVIEINSGDRTASTTLQLSHMRTAQEQKTLLPVVQARHPLYNEMWLGTSLLDGSKT